MLFIENEKTHTWNTYIHYTESIGQDLIVAGSTAAGEFCEKQDRYSHM